MKQLFSWTAVVSIINMSVLLFSLSTGDSGHPHQPSHQWPTLILCYYSYCYQAGETLLERLMSNNIRNIALSQIHHVVFYCILVLPHVYYVHVSLAVIFLSFFLV